MKTAYEFVSVILLCAIVALLYAYLSHIVVILDKMHLERTMRVTSITNNHEHKYDCVVYGNMVHKALLVVPDNGLTRCTE